MSAIRLSLLFAFAGGCLTNAVLFGLWRASDGGGASEVKQPYRSQRVVELATAVVQAPSAVEPARELDAVSAHARTAATDPAPTGAAQDLNSGEATPAGSAVSDVLTRLESAYRERVVPPAAGQAPPTQERLAAVVPVEAATAAAELARAIPPVAIIAPVVAPIAVAASTERAIARAAPALAAVAPQVAAVPAYAAPVGPPQPAIHYGDVNQTTYITNVRQGDVYLMQMQMQQLAMLQYMQLLGASSGVVAQPRYVPAQRTPFPSGITNPDNPWGFQFSPPNLVR